MTRETLLAFLDACGIGTQTVDHPPLFTVEDSQKLRGEIEGGHSKNLFVKDKKGALFLAPGLRKAAPMSLLGACGRFSCLVGTSRPFPWCLCQASTAFFFVDARQDATSQTSQSQKVIRVRDTTSTT